MTKETFILTGILNSVMKSLLVLPADYEFEAITFETSDIDDLTLSYFMRVGNRGMDVKYFDIIVDPELHAYYIVSPMAPWIGIKIVLGDILLGIKRLVIAEDTEVWIATDYMVHSLTTTADYDEIEFADEKHEWFKDTGYDDAAIRYIAADCR